MSEENAENEIEFVPADGLQLWQVVIDGTVITMEIGFKSDSKTPEPWLRGTTSDGWESCVEIEVIDDEGTLDSASLSMAATYVIANLVDTEDWWEYVAWYEDEDEDDEDSEE